jgi:hypothetical protein
MDEVAEEETGMQGYRDNVAHLVGGASTRGLLFFAVCGLVTRREEVVVSAKWPLTASTRMRCSLCSTFDH